MRKQQAGFTLVELVMVIVILGILAATAVPKFVDLSTDAENAAVKGMAGALGSGSAINYATCKANPSSADCVTVASCVSIAGTVEGGVAATGVVGDYTVQAGAIAAGSSATCTVQKTSDATITATFTGHRP